MIKILIPRFTKVHDYTLNLFRPYKTFPADWHPIMKAFGGTSWQYRSVGKGQNSKTWLIKDFSRQWILKQYHSRFKFNDVLFIHTVLNELNRVGFPTIHLEQTVNKQTYLEQNGRYYILLRFVPGIKYSDFYVFPISLRLSIVQQAGAILSQYHQIMAKIDIQGQRSEGYKAIGCAERWDSYESYVDEWMQLTFNWTKRSPSQQPIAADIVQRIQKELLCLQIQEKSGPLLPTRIIHGDYDPCNLLIDLDMHIKAVLDLDVARIEQRIDDVVVALRKFAGLKRIGLDIASARAFLAGYQAVSPLTPVELDGLANAFQRTRLRFAVKLMRAWHTAPNQYVYHSLSDTGKWLNWLDLEGRLVFQNLVNYFS